MPANRFVDRSERDPVARSLAGVSVRVHRQFAQHVDMDKVKNVITKLYMHKEVLTSPARQEIEVSDDEDDRPPASPITDEDEAQSGANNRSAICRACAGQLKGFPSKKCRFCGDLYHNCCYQEHWDEFCRYDTKVPRKESNEHFCHACTRQLGGHAAVTCPYCHNTYHGWCFEDHWGEFCRPEDRSTAGASSSSKCTPPPWRSRKGPEVIEVPRPRISEEPEVIEVSHPNVPGKWQIHGSVVKEIRREEDHSAEEQECRQVWPDVLSGEHQAKKKKKKKKKGGKAEVTKAQMREGTSLTVRCPQTCAKRKECNGPCIKILYHSTQEHACICRRCWVQSGGPYRIEGGDCSKQQRNATQARSQGEMVKVATGKEVPKGDTEEMVAKDGNTRFLGEKV